MGRSAMVQKTREQGKLIVMLSDPNSNKSIIIITPKTKQCKSL